MASIDLSESVHDQVEAALTYSVATGERPVAATLKPGAATVYPNGTTADQIVAIRDVRPIANHLSLDDHGFVFRQHDTRVEDFYDEDELRAVYYPEVEAFITTLAGGRVQHTLTFDHTLRHGDEAAQRARRLREPVSLVHNDYTDWSGPQRVRDLLADEAAMWLRQRFAIIQVWRPIQEVIQEHPLAICDARTISPDDLIAAERRHPDRIGEIYHIAHNPNHRWYYAPNMLRHEAFVFKTYESAIDGRARFTAHTSFVDPNTPRGARPRESIETRSLVFFGE